MDNSYDKSIKYINIFNRIRKKTSSFEGFLIMKSLYFTNNASNNQGTYTLFFAGAGDRQHRGAIDQPDAGQVGQDSTNQAGYYWMSSRNTTSYGAWSMFIAGTSDPNVAPAYSNVTNSALSVRPMVESFLDSEEY